MATTRGVAFCTHKALQRRGMPVDGARVAIQGFGNIGGFTGTHLSQLGCRVIAVTDAYGGVYNANGLDAAELRE